MSLIAMRDAVIEKYGKGSFEAGYIQFAFARRETNYFIATYEKLMSDKYRR